MIRRCARLPRRVRARRCYAPRVVVYAACAFTSMRRARQLMPPMAAARRDPAPTPPLMNSLSATHVMRCRCRRCLMPLTALHAGFFATPRLRRLYFDAAVAAVASAPCLLQHAVPPLPALLFLMSLDLLCDAACRHRYAAAFPPLRAPRLLSPPPLMPEMPPAPRARCRLLLDAQAARRDACQRAVTLPLRDACFAAARHVIAVTRVTFYAAAPRARYSSYAAATRFELIC